ncbi:hypothetical protein [Sporosarcina sp. A2]|uniref:hypothetical protein n=1 Tax=Sporosarcina sp. A2 TaxID=3393449 RepID=UPI003D7C01DD
MDHPDIERTMLTGYPKPEYLDYERHARQCDVCKAGMNEGYLLETSGDCYCSSDCTAKDLPEMDELLQDGTLFWTDWYYEI